MECWWRWHITPLKLLLHLILFHNHPFPIVFYMIGIIKTYASYNKKKELLYKSLIARFIISCVSNNNAHLCNNSSWYVSFQDKKIILLASNVLLVNVIWQQSLLYVTISSPLTRIPINLVEIVCRSVDKNSKLDTVSVACNRN